MEIKEYCPFRIFRGKTQSNFGILILNYSFGAVRKHLNKEIWSSAVCRVCADGGSNVLKSFSSEKNEEFIPDLISGDFDSITEETKSFYEKKNVEFCLTPDQNANDFTKSVKKLKEKFENVNELVVFCSLEGRFDHSIGNIHSLFVLKEIYPQLDIFLATEFELVFLIEEKRRNRIELDRQISGEICSLLPFSSTSHVRTKGLKWNLTEENELSFEKCVSSSNSFSDSQTNEVEIITDKKIVWTMTFRN